MRLLPLLLLGLSTTLIQSLSIRIHVHSKFYITPMGQQCAYNASLDPSMYPCAHHGVCVRLNATYGQCLTQQEADQLDEAQD